MKIFIVDDNHVYARRLAEAVCDLGEVSVITSVGPRKMPPIEEVAQQLKEADIVLVDYDLCQYSGFELYLECCTSNKCFIGISQYADYRIGAFNFHDKKLLPCPAISRELHGLIEHALRSTG